MILAGRGSIPMRDVAEIEKLAEQVNEGMITGISSGGSTQCSPHPAGQG